MSRLGRPQDYTNQPGRVSAPGLMGAHLARVARLIGSGTHPTDPRLADYEFSKPLGSYSAVYLHRCYIEHHR